MKKPLLIAFCLIGSALGQAVSADLRDELINAADNSQLNPLIPPIIVLPPDTEADYEVRTAGAHFFKQVISSTKPQTTQSRKFVPLKHARTKVTIPPRSTVLLNASFDAESRCSDNAGTTEGGWCEVRILINGAEGAPRASSFPPDTFAFDSTDSGNEGQASWESHAMSRHRCIKNNSDNFKTVEVAVEWKLTNFSAAADPEFWLDDWSLVVEMAEGCRMKKVVAPPK